MPSVAPSRTTAALVPCLEVARSDPMSFVTPPTKQVARRTSSKASRLYCMRMDSHQTDANGPKQITRRARLTAVSSTVTSCASILPPGNAVSPANELSASERLFTQTTSALRLLRNRNRNRKHDGRANDAPTEEHVQISRPPHEQRHEHRRALSPWQPRARTHRTVVEQVGDTSGRHTARQGDPSWTKGNVTSWSPLSHPTTSLNGSKSARSLGMDTS